MKKFVKYGLIYTSLFAIAGGVSFGIQAVSKKDNVGGSTIANGGKNDNDNNFTMTAGEKLVSSLLGYEGMNITANIDMVTGDNKKIEFDFVGGGSIQDISDIKIGGNLSMNLNGTFLDADFSYFGDTLGFHVLNNYFKLEKADLTDFVEMVPEYGVQLEMPEGFDNLDIATITSKITSISDEDKKTLPAGGYYYEITIGDLEVKVKTDDDDNFKGLIVDPFFYKDMKFSLYANLEETIINDIESLNLLEGPDANKYQDFQPALNLFDAAAHFVKKDKMSINLGLVLDKASGEETNNVLSTDIDINFNKETKQFSLSGDINENERTHSFLAAYEDEKIYANFHDVYVSVETDSICNLVEYVFDYVLTNEEEPTKNILNSLTEETSKIDIDDIIAKVRDTVGHIDVGQNRISLNLDLSVFDESLKPMDVVVSFDNGELIAIEIKDLSIQNYNIDLTASFQEYNAPVLEKARYVSIEPAIGLVPTILDLIKETSFRLEFDALVEKKDETARDVTINGGLQFDIKDGFGYGDMKIVDSDNYEHRIKADMPSKDSFFFSYNEKLNGKFDSATVLDIVDLVKELVSRQDDHYLELLADLTENETSSVIQAVMNGQYGALLTYNIIKNLEITTEHIAFDASLEVVGMDKDIHIEIGYTSDEETHFADLKYLKLSGIELDDAVISANVRLEKFDPTLEKTRLDPTLSYMDLSDIKVLLELGVKTSEFNYYHFSADIQLSLGDWKIESVPVDIKIRNEKGDVKVDAYFSDLPYIVIVTPNEDYYSPKNRTAHVMYYQHNIYIQRTETIKTALILGKTKQYTLTRRCDADFFFDNILEVLLRDVLSLGDTIYNLIQKSDSTSSGEGEKQQIHYEELINDFLYNRESGYFYADINLAEIAHDKKFSLLTAKIYEEKETHKLSGLDAHLTISLSLIKINIDAKLKLLSDSQVNVFTFDDEGNITGSVAGTTLDFLDAYVPAHVNDPLNEKIVTVK